jgi:transposase
MGKKNYTEEFKASAIKLAREAKHNGKKVEVVAREMGVHPNSLRDWVRYDDFLHAGDGTNTEGLDEKAELEQLRKENRILKMEREILKKAAAFFAKENS